MAEPKVVIITGAAGNLGVALCGVLAAQGHRVVAVGRDQAELDGRFGSMPDAPKFQIPAGDLAEPGVAEALVARVVQEAGRLDAVAHTVGGFVYAPLSESGAEVWERMLRMNLISTLHIFRAALPALQAAGGGSLVSIGAGAGMKASSGLSAYAAAKAGVLRLMESAADETKSLGVRVNAVMPSIIDTPQNRASMPDADTSKWVTAGQVAEVIAFLISDAASGVTGAAIPVTGRG